MRGELCKMGISYLFTDCLDFHKVCDCVYATQETHGFGKMVGEHSDAESCQAGASHSP